MLIAIPSAVGLAVLAKPISDLLFWGADNTSLTTMTRAGSLAVVFFSLINGDQCRTSGDQPDACSYP